MPGAVWQGRDVPDETYQDLVRARESERLQADRDGTMSKWVDKYYSIPDGWDPDNAEPRDAKGKTYYRAPYKGDAGTPSDGGVPTVSNVSISQSRAAAFKIESKDERNEWGDAPVSEAPANEWGDAPNVVPLPRAPPGKPVMGAPEPESSYREGWTVRSQAQQTAVSAIGAKPPAVPQEDQTQAFSDALAKSKPLRDLASKSPEDAAAVQPEAAKLGWWTRWISGVNHEEPNQAAPYANAGIDYPLEKQHVNDIPGVVSSNFSRAMISLRADWEGLKQFTLERLSDPAHLGPALGLDPEDPNLKTLVEGHKASLEAQKQITKDYSDLANSPKTPLEEQSAEFPQEAVRMAAGMVPLVAAGPFGEVGAFAAVASQTVGNLTRQGVSPDRAATFGLLAGYAGSLMGSQLSESLAPLARVLGAQKLVGSAVSDLSVKALALDFSRHVGIGWAANTGMLLSDKMALRLQDVADTGRKIDPSEFAQDVASAAKESAELIPMLGGFAALGLAGKFWEAHGNGLHHDALTGPIADSKLSPDQLRELIRNSSRNGRVYIDPDHFEKVIRAAGQDPAEVAAKINDDGGQDFRASKQSGVLMDLPLDKYLVDLKEHHEAMRDGVAFQDDGATLTRNGGKWLQKELAEELYGKIPDTGGKAALAHELTPDQQKIVNAWGVSDQVPGTDRLPLPQTVRATPAEVARDVHPSDRPNVRNLPDWAREAMVRAGLDPARPLNDIDLENQSIKNAIGLDPSLSQAQKDLLLRTGSPREVATVKVRAPGARALEMHAEEVVKDLTVDGLGTRKYKQAADAAQKVITRAAANKTGEDVSDSVFKQKLNAAFEKARRLALDVAIGFQGIIKTASSTAVRSKIYIGGHPEYGIGHDMILEALGARAPDGSYRPSDFQAVTDELVRNGEKLEFDADAIRDLVNNPRSIGELTQAELENVARAVKNLQDLAAERNSTLVNDRRVARQGAIQNDIGPAAVKGQPAKPGFWRGALRDLLQSDRRDAQSSNLHTLLNQLGAWGRSQTMRWLEVRRAEDVLLNKVVDLFTIPKELRKLGNADVAFPDWMPENARAVYGEGFKQRDVWRMILQSGTDEGIGALSRGWNALPEQIHSWFNEVAKTAPEWDLVKNFWAQSKEFGDMEAAADANRGGTPMLFKHPRKITTPFGEVDGGYSPVRWHRKGQALPANPSLGDPSRGAYAMTDVEHGFTETQQEGVTDVPDVSFDLLGSHYRGLVRDISRGDFVRDQSRMLNDENFRSAVRPHLGEDYLKALDAWHNTVASGQLQNIVGNWYRDPLISKARGVSARIVFNLNTKVLFGLVSHLPFAKAVMGDQIDLMAGIGKALSPEARQEALERSKVLPYRNDRVYQKLNEAEGAILRDDPSQLEAAFRRPNQMFWHGADMSLTHIIWHGVHERALSNGFLPEDAIKHADLWTDRLMPAIDIYGKALRTTDSNIGLLFLVKNFESTVWNVKAMREFDARSGVTQGGSPNLFAWKLGLTGALGLGHFLFYGHGRNQEEQKMGGWGWAPYAAREGLEAATYGNLFTHMAAQNFGVLLDGRLPGRRDITLFDTPEHAQIQQFVSNMGKAVRAAEGRGRPSAAVVAGLQAASRLLGGPTSLLRSADAAYKVGQYRLLGKDEFVSPPPATPVGEAAKIWFGDVDKWESNVGSEFDNLWRH